MFARHAFEHLVELYFVLLPGPFEILEINRVPLVSHGRRTNLPCFEGFPKFGDLGTHEVPSIESKLAERSRELHTSKQVVRKWLRWENLRADRRGLKTQLLEHSFFEGLASATSGDAKTNLGIVHAHGTRDFSNQFFRSSTSALNVCNNPIENRREPETNRDGKSVLAVRSANLRLVSKTVNLLRKMPDNFVSEPSHHIVVSLHKLHGTCSVKRIITRKRHMDPTTKTGFHFALGDSHPGTNVVLSYFSLDVIDLARLYRAKFLFNRRSK